MTELTFPTLCRRLQELVSDGAPLTVVAAICETGADHESIRTAFRYLESRGVAKLIGGANRGWSLVRNPR